MFDITLLESLKTPFYLYDTALLRKTIENALDSRPSDNYVIHYAVKANANPEILAIVAGYGLGADCVSIGEMRMALKAGFSSGSIVFAGVGKTDEEIRFAIENEIECLNVESHEELEVIGEIAAAVGKIAKVALRVNPDIDAHTHHYITTGLEEDKFGIDRRMIDRSVELCASHPFLQLVGLHFHIGSQILTNEPFKILCERINELSKRLKKDGVALKSINVGGGIGIDYDEPDQNPIADFRGFFDTLHKHLDLDKDQQCLCELGRSIVAQCGSLISRVVYVKEGIGRKFLIIDAGMNDLIRPALYQAHHKIENISSQSAVTDVYDVVGPICESSDTFGKDVRLPVSRRGDLIAIRSAGAYGESMASTYNGRPLPASVFC